MLCYIFGEKNTYVPLRVLHIKLIQIEIVLSREEYWEYRVLPVRGIRGKLRFSRQSTDVCHLRGKSISERRNEFTVRGVPERTLSCRSCVSERYGAANRRHDGTDILFRSLIHRRLYDIVYRLGNGAVKISKLLTSFPAPSTGARATVALKL